MNKLKATDTDEPGHRSPVHEQVYEALCEGILGGEFVPGVAVTLRGIAEGLGVSPMPVREAVRRLVAENALEVLGNRRICVTPMTSPRLQELYHARLSLEPELAAKSIDNLGAEEIETLQQIDEKLNESLRTGDVDTYIRCNRQFHFGIYRRAESPVLYPLVRSLWLQFAPFTRIVFGRMGTEVLQDFHADALAALHHKDRAALEQAIDSDIREGMDKLAGYLKREGSI